MDGLFPSEGGVEGNEEIRYGPGVEQPHPEPGELLHGHPDASSPYGPAVRVNIVEEHRAKIPELSVKAIRVLVGSTTDHAILQVYEEAEMANPDPEYLGGRSSVLDAIQKRRRALIAELQKANEAAIGDAEAE